ncbi:phenylacetate--CoA ligase family protein [Variovorax sp. M-6]|uniref:phenylacetate--CoA ligase family protein n=1 Tax=Variovorax sp. M-6 TaxID=3233041 RepID=UPI003F9A4DD6
MNAFFDALETRPPAEREAAQMAALALQVAHAQQNAPAFADILRGVDAASIHSRRALARLPVTRKTDLLARQKRLRPEDPFGGFSTLLRGPQMLRLFASPGTVYEPEGTARDYWRSARALHAAGLRAGELVHIAFSYHMTPGAFLFESGALALGCTVFPAGTGQTEQQLHAIAELRPDAYIGTPSFLRILLEKAQDIGVDVRSLRKAAIGGEACPPSLTDWFRTRGVEVFQTYATADLGLVAYETAAREGLVLDERVIVEIVNPGTGDPVPEGEIGELVVTTLNPAYPLIRFATGDLSALLPGRCPTGRTAPRIRGWMGRADQTTKVRGIFVHPSQVGEVVRHFPEVLKARMVVSGEMANDQVCLKVEVAHRHDGLRTRLEASFREVTKLRGEAELVAPGSLQDDGKTIEDRRTYS